MKIEGIYANGIELTPTIEKRIASRVAKLAKLTKRMEPATVAVEVGKPSGHHKKGPDVFYAEFRVKAGEQEFFSSKKEADLHKAIEKVRDDMYQQIHKWKKKQVTDRKKQGRAIKDFLRWGK